MLLLVSLYLHAKHQLHCRRVVVKLRAASHKKPPSLRYHTSSHTSVSILDGAALTLKWSHLTCHPGWEPQTMRSRTHRHPLSRSWFYRPIFCSSQSAIMRFKNSFRRASLGRSCWAPSTPNRLVTFCQTMFNQLYFQSAISV